MKRSETKKNGDTAATLSIGEISSLFGFSRFFSAKEEPFDIFVLVYSTVYIASYTHDVALVIGGVTEFNKGSTFPSWTNMRPHSYYLLRLKCVMQN